MNVRTIIEACFVRFDRAYPHPYKKEEIYNEEQSYGEKFKARGEATSKVSFKTFLRIIQKNY